MSCCPKGSAPYLAADHNDEGKVGEADGVKYYHVGSGPNGVLLLPDIWGWNGGRIRALADDMAKKYKLNCWIPKMMPKFEEGTDDDGLPPDFDPASRFGELFEKGYIGPGDAPWGPKTMVAKSKKIIDAMKKDGVIKYACIGFCYGAYIGMHLSKEISGDELVCCASPHPSAVQLESGTGGDVEKLVKAQKCPWAFYPAGDPSGTGADPVDYDSTGTVMKILEGLFPGRNRSRRFKAMSHGFVTRGAIKSGHGSAMKGDDVKASIEECMEDILDYLSDFGLVDGRVSMKVTTKKSLNFYVNSAKSFFKGVESKDGTKKDAVDQLKISGLGDAVNVAVSAAMTAEKEGLAVIEKVETSYPALQDKGQPRILIKLVKSS
mmetsp:Transcript_51141/g.91881  ORF Transcript_51141/g.91881 Transcript_51141/m.91881 type:complete len:377 (+) Transcript_51141:97-1227(+)|eukprot:CAMPEP_0197623952 /NCGR_PEP_ID=MMETSP1338-20131121/3810_1 /TAXON_ID=43686 ORGANISM="Pelagodinium beii, Strain RCC1491" /NCGR_SAMPLE_ID=MMETSP1338 /ASSEMBLY_ACC=CAM_ASM_000754 /LENGTH=376 /DNA_ID=CAMNT_0043194047 /DNA_START=8 /DNA_END=1138 /DNA_ORIENTATION=+